MNSIKTTRSLAWRPSIILNLYEWTCKKHFCFFEYQSGEQTRDIRLSKQIALTTASGPPQAWTPTLGCWLKLLVWLLDVWATLCQLLVSYCLALEVARLFPWQGNYMGKWIRPILFTGLWNGCEVCGARELATPQSLYGGRQSGVWRDQDPECGAGVGPAWTCRLCRHI